VLHRHRLLLLLAFLSSCQEETESDLDRSNWTSAVSLQNRGEFDEALKTYREIARQTASDSLRSKAELEIGRVEVALIKRDRAIARLGRLSDQVDVRTLMAVERDIDSVVLDFQGTVFEDAIQDRAQGARTDARARHAKRRDVERGAVTNLVDRGEFAAALAALREIESGRRAQDRLDVAELLALVRTESESKADEILSAFEDRLGRSDDEAVAWLDEAMAPFRGTRAYARLLAARLASAPAVSEEPEDGG